jgi:hypothetical protein
LQFGAPLGNDRLELRGLQLRDDLAAFDRVADVRPQSLHASRDARADLDFGTNLRLDRTERRDDDLEGPGFRRHDFSRSVGFTTSAQMYPGVRHDDDGNDADPRDAERSSGAHPGQQ